MALLMEVDEDPLTDSSGNGNTAALLAAGSPNYAIATPPDTYSVGYYDFDGDDDKAEVADSAGLDFTAAFSQVLWAKRETGANILLHRYSGDGYYFQDSTKWLWVVFVDAGADTVTSNNNTTLSWEHIVCVRQTDGTLIMYVDGVLQSDSGSKAGVIDGNTALHLGEHTNGSKNWAGHMDEVALFSDELTITEVNDIMDNGLEGGAAPAAVETIHMMFDGVFS